MQFLTMCRMQVSKLNSILVSFQRNMYLPLNFYGYKYTLPCNAKELRTIWAWNKTKRLKQNFMQTKWYLHSHANYIMISFCLFTTIEYLNNKTRGKRTHTNGWLLNCTIVLALRKIMIFLLFMINYAVTIFPRMEWLIEVNLLRTPNSLFLLHSLCIVFIKR